MGVPPPGPPARAQESPRKRFSWALDALRADKSGLGATQDGPGARQQQPRAAQERPRATQERPRATQERSEGHLGGMLACFGTFLDGKIVVFPYVFQYF